MSSVLLIIERQRKVKTFLEKWRLMARKRVCGLVVKSLKKKKKQSERVEGVDLPEEEDGEEVEGDVWKRKSKSLFTSV